MLDIKMESRGACN